MFKIQNYLPPQHTVSVQNCVPVELVTSADCSVATKHQEAKSKEPGSRAQTEKKYKIHNLQHVAFVPQPAVPFIFILVHFLF